MEKMLKKAISVLLIAVMVLCSAPLTGFVGLELPSLGEIFSAKAEASTTGTCGENLTWSFDESTGELVISGTGDMDNWSSPSSVPWSDYSNLTETVTISEGVTSIGDYSFGYFYDLRNITISDSVTTIGHDAFRVCSSLTNISIPDSVTVIGYNTFLSCASLTSIVIPDGVTTIERSTFSGCTSLSETEIPDNVTSIGNSAFRDCTNLKSIKIPDGVTVLNSSLFFNCSALESITIGDSVTQIMSNAFYGCENLDEVRYIGDEESWSAITVKDGNEAFTNANLIIVSPPVTGICGDNLTWTFDLSTYELVISGTGDMYNWTSSSVPWYDYRYAIETVAVSEGVTSVGNWAFSDCDLLSDVKISDSVKVVGENAFYGCEYLSDLNLGNGVEIIDEMAFYGCGFTDLVIPDSVTTIGGSAFYSCENLERVYIGKGLKSLNGVLLPFENCFNLLSFNVSPLNTAFSSDEYGVLYNKSKTSLLKFPSASKRTCYVIPEGVKSIGTFAFRFCENLESITVPDSVIYIAQNAIVNCEKFKEIYYLGTKSQWDSITVAENGNEQIRSTAVFYVTDATDYLAYTVDENGNATITDCDTSISGFVSVPSTVGGYPVTAIGNSAFSACNSIKKIILPEGVVSLGTNAFANCTLLSEITLPESLETIGNGAFRSCTSLRNIDIPEGVTSIGSVAFNGCTSLKSAAIPDNASIGPSTFQGCSALTEVTLGNNLTSIPQNLFRECSSLETIIIPDGVTSILNYAFINCTSLNNIVIPATVTNIVVNAFSGCTGLTDVYFRGSEEDWNAINIASTNNSAIINATKHYNLRAVTWNSDGKKTVDYYEVGEKIVPALPPRKTGCEFVGWDKEIPTFMPENDLVFNAVWEIGSFTVTFDAADGTFGSENIMIYNVKFGSDIPVPENPVKDNYTFIGWDKEIPETMPADDLVFTAVYEFTGGSIGENVSFAFDKETGLLTVSGAGAISSAPWLSEKEKITSVVISEGITSIPDNAFDGCSNLTEVFLPATLVSIGNSAFTNCEKLNNVYYADGEAEWNVITVGTGNDSLAAADMHFTYTPEDFFVYTISNGEATVTGCNFELMQYGVVEIPSVLEDCAVTAIGTKAFYGNAELVSVTIPSSVKTIGASAFGKCTSLASVTIANGVETIENAAFKDCSALTELTIPEGVTSIGSSAFTNCTALKTVNIPSSVESLNSMIFSGCNSLTAINVNETNAVYSSDENGVLFNKDKTVLVFYPIGKTETEYTVPDGVTQIGNSAFKGAKNLTNVVVPEGVTSIGTTAFAVCTSLEQITLPMSIETISNGAFNSCSALAHVYYPGMTFDWNKISIGSSNEALDNAEKHFAPDPELYLYYTIVNGEYAVISGCNSSLLTNGRLYIPETLDGYPVREISAWAFENQGSVTDIILPDVPLNIGQNAFYDTAYYQNQGNWVNDELYIGNHLIKVNSLVNKAITVKDGTISIADFAVGSSFDIVTAHIPVSVKYVGFYGIGDKYDLDYIFYNGTREQWNEIVFDEEYNATVYFDYLDSGYENGYVYYITNSGEAVITNGLSLSGVVDIPVTLGGYPVVEIGEEAFYNDKDIVQVNIPDTVIHIGDNAFGYCYYLTSVMIPDSVTSIGVCAFQYCQSLTSITIGNSVTSIGGSAFSDCDNLTSVTIPDSVTSMGGSLFWSCDNLESVTIGSGLEEFPSNAFRYCYDLESVEISQDNPNLVSENGIVFTKDKKTLVYYPGGIQNESYEIPAETELIMKGAFYEADYLRNLTVNENNTAFASVDGVLFSSDKTVLVLYPMGKSETVYCIPDSVTTVASCAFYIRYSGLRKLSVPQTVAQLEEGAFYFNNSLDAVYYQGTEEEWTALTKNFNSNNFGTVYFNTSVGDDTFGLIYSFADGEAAVIGYSIKPEGSVEIPFEANGLPVTSIGNYAFSDCDNLTSVTIPDGVKTIGDSSFYNCYNLTSVTIPDSVEIIGYRAFDDCYDLKNISIGNNVTTIGSYAFYYCQSLTSITIPDSVTSIGDYAFYYCNNLTSITIGSGIEEFPSDAFEYCSKLSSVEISQDNPSLLSENGIVFSKDKKTLFYYPQGIKAESYEIPEDVENIDLGAFYHNSSLKSFTVNENNDTFTSIDGVLFSADEATLVVCPRGKISDIYIVPDGVTVIASGAFYVDYEFNKISIPASVTVFEDNAFYFEYSLDSTYYQGTGEEWTTLIDGYYYPYHFGTVYCNSHAGRTESGLVYYVDENSDAVIIGADEAFSGDVVIPATIDGYPVKRIDDSAFYNNNNIINLTIENGVEEIGDSAFAYCYYLGSVIIPDSVTALGKSAFYSCNDLETVRIGSGVTEIYENTFANCYALKSYEISENNTTYSSDENGVLYNKEKTKLVSYPMGKTDESYEIAESVTEVVPYALQGNSNLKAITVDENNGYFASVDGVLFSKDLTVLVCYPFGRPGSMYFVPDGVTTIATGAFLSEYDGELRNVSIPGSVTALEERAFITSQYFSKIFFGGTQEEWNLLVQQNGYSIGYSEIYFEASAGIDSSGLIYYINEDSEAVIIGSEKIFSGDFVIPSTLGGCPVTGISDEVFYGMTELTAVTIPDTVRIIGDEAFAYCVKLESVTIPASVTSIDESSFFSCVSIEEFIVDEENEYYSADEYGVLFDKEKTILHHYPLNSEATDYVIPDTVTYVNFAGFHNARNLRTLTISASVEDYDGYYYLNLGLNFEKIIVDENNPEFSSDEQGALYTKNKDVLYFVPPAIRSKNFVIPDTVTEISPCAFMFTSDMIITIPDSLSTDVEWTCFGSAKEYIVSETNPHYSSYKGALYNKDKTVLIRYPINSEADIHVAPETFTRANESAFMTWDFQLVCEEPGMFFVEEYNAVENYFKICDKLCFHAPVPFFAYGVNRICVPEADEVKLSEVNSEMAELFDDFREGKAGIEDTLESGELDNDIVEKTAYSAMCEVYKTILTVSDCVIICENDHSDVHIHEWVETVVTETCTVDGSITNVCPLCDMVTVEVIPACHKPGEWVTVIEPTTKAEGKKVKYCTVCEETVEEEVIPKLDIPVTGIDLKETEAEIVNYTSYQLNATTVPVDCNNPKILWSSSDESVVTVDENGVVTAVSIGNAIITATTEEGGFSAECAITVVPAEFTVTLNIDGIQKFVSVTEGAAISIDNPVKEGYTFVAWSPEMPGIMPAENLEFTAVFEVNSYTVEWNIDGLTLHESYQFGAKIDKSKTFTKKGYTFAGWTPEIPDTMPAENLVFTATWTANLYDAVFFTNGGSFPDGDSIKRIPTAYNSEIAVPENPVKPGYEFMGWAYNGKNIGTNAGIMDSIDGKEFEAIWASNNTAKYRIETYTMNTVGGYDKSSVTLSGNVYDNVSITPEVETGFVLNEEMSVLSGMVLADETIVLKVYYDRLSYNFNVVVDGVTETVSYYYGAMISEPAIPVKEGYDFVGWNKEIPLTMPANDITVTAKFKEKEEDKTYAKLNIATPEKRTLYYGESITLYASVKNLPEGAKIKWYVDGDGVSIKPSSNGKSCKVTSTSNGNVVIRAMVVDAKGNTIKGSDGKPVADYETVYSEVTLWQIIVNFFRNLFGKTNTASVVFKGIF